MTIKKVLDVILQKASVIILVAVIFGTVGGYYYFFIAQSEYTASTQFFVLNNNIQDESVDLTQLKISDMLIADYNVIATSKSVKDEVAQRLNLPNLSGYNISVSSVNQTRVLKIIVVYKDPKLAAAVANKLVEVFSERVKEIMNVDNVNIIDVALVPKSASGPARLRNTVFLAFAGFVLTVAIIILREMLDNTVKTAEDIEEIFEISVLAQVPRFHTSRKTSGGKKNLENANDDNSDEKSHKKDIKRTELRKGEKNV